jgi:hypothetical protein
MTYLSGVSTRHRRAGKIGNRYRCLALLTPARWRYIGKREETVMMTHPYLLGELIRERQGELLEQAAYRAIRSQVDGRPWWRRTLFARPAPPRRAGRLVACAPAVAE